MVHVEGVIGRMSLACKIIIVQSIIQKISMKIHILTKTVIIQYTDEGIMEELFITKQSSTRSTIVMLFLTTHTSLKEVWVQHRLKIYVPMKTSHTTPSKKLQMHKDFLQTIKNGTNAWRKQHSVAYLHKSNICSAQSYYLQYLLIQWFY